ncbi:hypothetical protein, partial [Oceanidesulfovibrio marinus]|uniref:hypothetical protein n=1 Tax=Oceanidesulfovibrio marinus TaxID=370038 RepID=UPI001ABFF05E
LDESELGELVLLGVELGEHQLAIYEREQTYIIGHGKVSFVYSRVAASDVLPGRLARRGANAAARAEGHDACRASGDC